MNEGGACPTEEGTHSETWVVVGGEPQQKFPFEDVEELHAAERERGKCHASHMNVLFFVIFLHPCFHFFAEFLVQQGRSPKRVEHHREVLQRQVCV